MKLLHNRLEHSSHLADNILSRHLGALLLQPQALQLLLSSLPAIDSRQSLLYQSLCDQFRPGTASSCMTLTPVARAITVCSKRVRARSCSSQTMQGPGC